MFQDSVSKDLLCEGSVSKDPVLKDLLCEDPISKDPLCEDPLSLVAWFFISKTNRFVYEAALILKTTVILKKNRISYKKIISGK